MMKSVESVYHAFYVIDYMWICSTNGAKETRRIRVFTVEETMGLLNSAYAHTKEASTWSGQATQRKNWENKILKCHSWSLKAEFSACIKGHLIKRAFYLGPQNSHTNLSVWQWNSFRHESTTSTILKFKIILRTQSNYQILLPD